MFVTSVRVAPTREEEEEEEEKIEGGGRGASNTQCFN